MRVGHSPAKTNVAKVARSTALAVVVVVGALATAAPAGAAVSSASPATVASAPASGNSAVDPSIGHRYRHGWVGLRGRPAVHAAAGAATTTNPLIYRGGVGGVGVTTGTPSIYLVFYGSQWGTQGTTTVGGRTYATFTGDTKSVAPLLQEFFAGLGTAGETWSGVMTQYCQGGLTGATTCPAGTVHVGFPTNGTLSGVWEDSSVASPAQATGAQLAAESQTAAAHFGNTTAASNRNVQYVIVSPSGTHPDGFNTTAGNFCAWHDYSGDTSLGVVSQPNGPTTFTNLPYIPDMGASCGQNFVNAGAAGTLDGVTIVEGHEYAETVTDQFPAGGWTDSTGAENGDKCSWITAGATGGAQNVTFATGSFAMQATWGNDGASGAGACQISHAYVTSSVVSVTNPGAQSGTTGTSSSLQMVASDSASGQTLTWAATGLPAGLTIGSSSGLISGTPTAAVWNAPVTVTLTDGFGTVGTTSFTWTVASPGGNTVTVVAPPSVASSTAMAISPVQPSAADTQVGQTYTWSASGLPSGLSINATTGAISGVPAFPTSTTATVTATDAAGFAGSAQILWTVNNKVTVSNPGPLVSAPSVAITPIQLVASDSASGQTFTWSATGLPSGLSIDPSTGIVSGSPTSAGSSTAVVTATDTTSAAGSASFTWTISDVIVVTNPGAQSSISGAAVVGLVSSATDSAAGQTLTWSATGLPAGLVINSATGTISGTPTTACACSVTLTATDTTTAFGKATFTWTVTNAVSVTSPGAKSSATGAAIASLTLPVSDSSSVATIASWSATGLPTGLAINATTGTVTGTPTTAGIYSVTIKATDSAGFAGSASFSWTIANTVTVTAKAAQTSTTGTAISTVTNSATDSQSGQTFTWSATGLPTGLSISSSSGSITGTPTAPCSCSVTVKATDKTGASGTTVITWTVNNRVTVSSVSAQASTSGKAVTSVTARATDSQSGQTFTWSATGLPAGLTIGATTGTMSGTPTAACSCAVILTATDTSGAKGTTTFTWKVSNTVTVTSPGSQSTALATSVSLQIKGTDSATGQTLTWTATGLPAGLAMASSTGLITGKPTAAGTASVTVKATDTSGASGSVTFTWTTK